MTNAAVNQLYNTQATVKKVSLFDRFMAYMQENGAFIAAAMLAQQGNAGAWRMYIETK